MIDKNQPYIFDFLEHLRQEATTQSLVKMRRIDEERKLDQSEMKMEI